MKHINVTLTDNDADELGNALLYSAWFNKENKDKAGVNCASYLAHKLLNTSLKCLNRNIHKQLESILGDPLTWVDVYSPNGDCITMKDFVKNRSLFNE